MEISVWRSLLVKKMKKRGGCTPYIVRMEEDVRLLAKAFLLEPLTSLSTPTGEGCRKSDKTRQEKYEQNERKK